MEENKVAIIGIIVEKAESVDALNVLLHEFRQYIIGRMGIPYHQKNISVISIVLDAPQNTISALSGKIGQIPGISAKTALSKV